MTCRTVPRHHDTSAVCLCVADHRPAVLEFVWHHIRPLYAGGRDTPDGVLDQNGIWLCPTAHYNVHEILRRVESLNGVLTWGDAVAFWPRPVNRYAFGLAHEGFRRTVEDEWAA